MQSLCLSAVWGGAKLADVLELLGIPKLTASTVLGGRHVEFVSVDRCKVYSYIYIHYFLSSLVMHLVDSLHVSNIGGEWWAL